MLIDLDRQPKFAALLGLGWLMVALVLLLLHWPQTAQTLLDTDDAMRLVEMRAWLNGPGLLSGWYDLHQSRLQPPGGVDMHWSRLIDAGLAGLFTFFHLFADQADAERLMRAWWPLLWLLPTMAGMTAIAWRVAGREAALVALLFAILAVPAYQQFSPGRIDHHNVQIALTLLTVAAVAWSDRTWWCGYAAGALSGVLLAIGIEALPYLAACGLALALHYVVDRYAGVALARYGVALALFAALAFGVSVGPQHWMRKLCDAIAINTAAAAVCGGLLLALAGWLRHRDRVTRIAAVLGSGMGTLAVLLLLEPQCIRGPMAMVDPAIWPIWLGDVREMQPLWSVLRTESVDRRRHRRVSGGGAGGSRGLVAPGEAAPRFRVPCRSYGVFFGGGHHRRRDPRLFLRDLAGYAAGRRAGAAADCGVRDQTAGAAPGDRSGLDPDGGFVGGDRRRHGGRSERQRQLFPAGHARLLRDRELRPAAYSRARLDRGRRELRAIRAGADPSFGPGGALPSAFQRYRYRPPHPVRAAGAGARLWRSMPG